jgi:hypothetical protein
MTYIWNRAERVPKNTMPYVVIDSFVTWQSRQLKNIQEKPEKEQKRIHAQVKRQRTNLKRNLESLGYSLDNLQYNS